MVPELHYNYICELGALQLFGRVLKIALRGI